MDVICLKTVPLHVNVLLVMTLTWCCTKDFYAISSEIQWKLRHFSCVVSFVPGASVFSPMYVLK